MDTDAESSSDGWAALRAGDWAGARSFFESRLREGDTRPAVLEGASWAAWWQDDGDAMFDARERAFRAYRASGDDASAGRVAAWLAADHVDFRGSVSVASGWLERSRRLLEPLPEGPDHGWYAIHGGYVAIVQGELDRAQSRASRAAAIGRSHRVPDLEMLGLALGGACHVARGSSTEGLRMLDEAAAIALAEEAEIPISSAWTCCFAVSSCHRIQDYERADEWCERIADFAERYGSRYMLGFCRAEYAAVHLWRGAWDAAEAALTESVAFLRSARAPLVGGALTQLAELRRLQGRRSEAEALLAEVGVSRMALLCRAEMALEDGRPAEAVDLGERALRSVPDGRMVDHVAPLALLVRARVAAGTLDSAEAAAEELAGLAARTGTAAQIAGAARARGLVALAVGEPERAKRELEDAIDGFGSARGVFEVAATRCWLAEALAALGRNGDAVRQARQALARFESLGASVAADGARALEARLRAPTGEARVSRREVDVLALLAEGFTNREIAARLHISEHTVHRHVNNILRKLSVPTRAAAAAIGVQTGLVSGPRQ